MPIRAAAWFAHVTDLLLDRMAARDLKDPSFRLPESPHPLEDILAAAQVLRVLAKPAWSEEDLELFDAYFPAATRADLFADEFEEARHRIRGYASQARRQLSDQPSRNASGR